MIIFTICTLIFVGCYILSGVMAGGVWPGKSIVLRFHPRYQRIYLYDGQYYFSESFYTYVEKLPDGNLGSFAKRYVDTDIGNVEICSDGTARYCGRYKWRLA